jgi:hypothetical protein
VNAVPRQGSRTPRESAANERLAAWLATPLADFVRDARVRLALVLEPSGRVLAQHGFTRSIDVMAACSLAAAIHASATELGRQLGDTLGPLHHGGADRQLFLAPLAASEAPLLLLAVFERDTTLGIVRHFSSAFARRVSRDMPARDGTPLLAADFERELGRNLATLFGRA